MIPEDVKPYCAYNGASVVWHGAESGVPNYEKVFKVGLKGLIKEAEERLREIQSYLESRNFLEAAIICLKATINFAHRYAKLARE